MTLRDTSRPLWPPTWMDAPAAPAPAAFHPAAATLIADARRLGVKLEWRGEELGIIWPRGTPAKDSQALREGLEEFEAEVLALIRRPVTPEEQEGSGSMADLLVRPVNA